jgi:hypothetical protein
VVDISAQRPLPGDDNRLYRIGVMLLNGYGYNWYRLDNQLRADDLLIRSQASAHLGKAGARLRDIETDYRKKYLPPPSREHPDADDEHLADAKRLRAARDRILVIDTKLRGGTVPSNDKIWQRYRSEEATLKRLIECDVVLVGTAKDIEAIVAAMSSDSALDDATEKALDDRLALLSAALSRRDAMLAVPV